MKKLAAITYLLVLAFSSIGQIDSSWQVLLLKKGNQREIKPDMYLFSKTGFYLYRNCMYEIDLKNKQNIKGRLIDIKPDTLFFTTALNEQAAASALFAFDTLAVFYKDLDKLNLIADRMLGLYNKHALDNFDFVFEKDTNKYVLESEWVQIFKNDPKIYELVPYMTSQGIDLLYEENGHTFYFQGTDIEKPDSSKMDNTYDIKNGIWFTPCKVEEINGLALGVYTKNTKNYGYNVRDSLIIRGLCLQINPFSIFFALHSKFTAPYPDSLDFYRMYASKDWQVKMKGVHISLITNINEMQIKGVNIAGFSTVVDEINGVTISGINNFAYLLNGVSIAALRNRATLAKGVQIGLFNKATDLRGFQFGLWNVNAKRSLPFINWQFKPK